jgi:hypothetical protein
VNMNLYYKAVCQRIFSVLRSVKANARYTPFGVRKKLIVSLIMPHIRRFNVTFNSCLRYVHDIHRREHVSHLVPTIIGVLLAIHLRIHLLTFLFKVLHIRHLCYHFTLFHSTSVLGILL